MADHHAPQPALVQESAMDYRQHEQTYDGFVNLVKYAILSIVILVVGLYAAIIAGQIILGVFFVIASVVVPIFLAWFARK